MLSPSDRPSDRPLVHRLDKLLVYQRSIALAARVAAVGDVPAYRNRPSRRSQLERSAESIYANIAEGSASGSNRNYARFLQYAIASSSELEGHLAFARAIHAISPEFHAQLTDETIQVRKMLIGLKRHLGKEVA